MPVIRQAVDRLPKERRSLLLEEVKNTLQDPANSPIGGPVVFEIPFTGTRYEVLVVWDRWEGVQPDERTEIISQAYGDASTEIAQAMGVTHDEALSDHLLPYAVQPCVREGEANLDNLRKAMLEEGAIDLGQGKVDLRFPTMRMAETALQRLCTRLPQGCWSLVVDA
jgi:hypothetical protein